MSKTHFVAPTNAALPPDTLATGFTYRLPNRRVMVILKDELAVVQFRRLLTREEAAPVGPGWANRVQVTRISLSIEALRCLTHFVEHLAVTEQRPSIAFPTLLFRRIPTA